MFKRFLVIAVTTLCTLPCLGKKTKEQTPDPAWAGITARGRMLAEYDAAARRASDAVRAANPAEGVVEGVVAEKTDVGWVVAFGRLNDARDKFLIAYQASQRGSSLEFNVIQNIPPQEDAGFFCRAFKGVETSRADFPGEKRPYNAAVLPAESDRMYVYLYPAQTKPGIYPLGGDARYLISPDGSSILEKRQLHKSILEINISGIRTQGKMEGGWHTHILSDVPEDTDVFYVLTRKPTGPEFVGGGKRVYKVQVDGTIVRVK